jgi:hypothetical protein
MAVNNKMPGGSKYHSKKVTCGDESFDSVKEYRRWCELKLLEKAGEITELERQVKFTLIPSQYEKVWNDKKNCFEKGKIIEREISYIADFVYKNRLDFQAVEDTKGFKTKDYIIKRKLMLWVHGIRILEV